MSFGICVTRCSFSSNLYRNAIARQVAGEIAPLNIASKKNFINIARQVADEGVLHDVTDAQVVAIVAQSRTMVYFVQRFEPDAMSVTPLERERSSSQHYLLPPRSMIERRQKGS